jgi:DNA-binding transcriptional LysR family regulator
VARLRDGRLDFGILRRQSIQPGLKSLTLKSVRYALFLPTHLAGTHSTDDVAASLGKVSFAMLEGTAEINTALAQWAETQGVRVQAPLRCTSLIQVAEAVKQLGMAAVLPTWAESALDPQRVVRFELPSLTKLGAPMRLVWSKRQSGVRTFLDRLAKLIESNLVR